MAGATDACGPVQGIRTRNQRMSSRFWSIISSTPEIGCGDKFTLWCDATPWGTLRRRRLSTDQSWSKNYIKSIYLCPGIRQRFFIGGLAHGHRAAILTAWNPRSKRLPSWINQKRQRRSVARLHHHCFPWRAWCGRGDWWEESLLIPGISLPEAYRHARQWQQNAFVYLDGHRVWLIYCEAVLGSVRKPHG